MKRGRAAGAPSTPLVLRAAGSEVWLPAGAAAIALAIAVFAFMGGVAFPGLIMSAIAVIAGAAAVHLSRWHVVLDDQGITVGGLMSQPLLAWAEVAAVQIEEPFARSPMRVKFVSRSGLPAETIAFPLRRIVEDDRRRLVAFLAGRGHQLQLGPIGWP